MSPAEAAVSISSNAGNVSGRWLAPSGATSCYVFAHGAGAGMDHPFMAACAEGLAERQIASLRYQFPYMEKGSGRPDVPAVCHATVRAAVAEAAKRAAGLKLIAGGKSFGGRMTSQAQAAEPLQRVQGLAFFGFPLHQPGKPSTARAEHLSKIKIPMFFMQGEKDKLAEATLLEPLVERLGSIAKLMWAPTADHSFHVLKRSGRSDEQILGSLLDAFAHWTAAI